MRWVWLGYPDEQRYTELKRVTFYDTFKLQEKRIAIVEFHDDKEPLAIDYEVPKEVEDDEEIFLLLTLAVKDAPEPACLRSLATGEVVTTAFANLDVYSNEDWFFARKKSDGKWRNIDPVGKSLTKL